MRRFVVDLAIADAEMLRYYRGTGQTVIATSREGKTLRFPARWLRAFVGRNGVQGTFALEVDAGYRLQRMTRLQ